MTSIYFFHLDQSHYALISFGSSSGPLIGDQQTSHTNNSKDASHARTLRNSSPGLLLIVRPGVPFLLVLWDIGSFSALRVHP